MLAPNGEHQLRHFTETAYPPTVTEIVSETIFHVVGYGHSNAGFIIGDTSVILIDTLDTDARGAKLRQIIQERTDKPVQTIIYTHGHPDHRGGAGAFSDLDPEIIAFAPALPILPRVEKLATIQDLRGTRQFGYGLDDEEAISQGIGIREGFTVGEGERRPLPPTTIYTDPVVERQIDGVRLSLHAAPGETEDQAFVWLDAYNALFCGDNYYGCWPNLYAIRGGQYRDIATWVASLDAMRALPAEALLPGHTKPILGREAVVEVLGNFRDALDYVLTETLSCMDRGMGIEETVEAVRLPDHLRDLPYLQEHYGTVPWSVRSIYTGYLGWFDGNPTNLYPLPRVERASRLVAMMGGEEAFAKAVHEALAGGETQWALELADLLLTLDPGDALMKQAKAQGLTTLGHQETSANGRHYYIAFARELLEEV